MTRSCRSGAVALLLAALSACDGEGQTPRTENGVPSVRIVAVDEMLGPQGRRFVGRVAPASTVDLAFEVGGLIVEMPVLTGQTAARGRLLAALDTADFDLARRQAEARLDLAVLEFERAEDLTARGAAPVARLDDALAQKRLAEVEQDTALRRLELARLKAPVDALVTRRLVDPFSFVAAGEPVIRIQDVSEMRVVISVPESIVAMAGSGNDFTATARLAALPGETFPLELREVVTEADPIAQTYEVSFAITAARDPRILPGMTATVEVVLDTAGEDTPPEIPLAALDTTGTAPFRVWVFDEDSGTVSARDVDIGLPGTATVPVLSGLERGERIVAAGVRLLSEGQRVRPMDF